MADVTSPFGFPYPEPTDLVRDGATDIEALAEGVNDQFAAGFQFAGQRTYTSSGQFVKADPLGTGDIGLRAIRVRLVGGGAGGRGVDALQLSGGGGGGAGGYGESFILASDLSASETVTRGAGSSGSADDSNPGNGGVSAFGGFILVGGGRGSTATGSGGTSSTGATGTKVDLNAQGGQGISGSLNVAAPGGSGGTSFFGGAGRGGRLSDFSSALAVGANAVAFGSGGGAGCGNGTDSTARVGGNGSNGIVIVEVFV